MTKKNILFVDDEPQILEGLRHRLRRQRRKWKMGFVGGGHEALERLREEPIDVIVTDMRMPQMDGAELLKRVQEEFPGIVRLVLSGHAELETAMRAVPVAHQFLNKPCDAGLLENVVERACSLHALVNDEIVRDTIGKIETLPSMPAVYNRLMAALAAEKTSLQDVTQILEQDMALCAKLLQIANSAFFRLPRTITRIEEAVSYLGFNTIKQVVLAAEVFGEDESTTVGGLSLEALQKHSLLVASIASSMFDDMQLREDAFVAALLHDIGVLLLIHELPDHLTGVLDDVRATGEPMFAVEEKMAGVTHAEVGAYLLGLWGLPYPVIEAVANHHAPGRVDQQTFGVLAAVHVADNLANEILPTAMCVAGNADSQLDEALLAELGVADKLDQWRELAEEQAAASAD